MPTKSRQNSVRDNENINDGSLHLSQCTGSGPEGKGYVAWSSI